MGMVAVLSNQRWRPKVALVLLILLTATLGACTFHRKSYNHHTQSLDVSFLEIGKTTRMDVLENLGPPTVPSDREIVRPGPSPRFFRYYVAEEKETKLVLAYFLALPFAWSDREPVYDLIVEFDEKGVVSDAHLARRETIWRPLSGESAREPERVMQLGKRGQ